MALVAYTAIARVACVPGPRHAREAAHSAFSQSDVRGPSRCSLRARVSPYRRDLALDLPGHGKLVAAGSYGPGLCPGTGDTGHSLSHIVQESRAGLTLTSPALRGRAEGLTAGIAPSSPVARVPGSGQTGILDPGAEAGRILGGVRWPCG